MLDPSTDTCREGPGHGRQKVTVIVRIRARPGMERWVDEELLSLLAPTRAEEGCLNYDMHRAVKDGALFLVPWDREHQA